MEGMLEGKIAVITGAGQGLGKAIAKAFAKEKAGVALSDVNEAAIEEVVEEIISDGGKAVAVKADVAKREQTEKLMRKSAEEFGTIDILVNNAGIVRDSMIHKMTEQQWDQVLAVHAKGTFNCIQAVSSFMMRKKTGHNGSSGGRIINVTSGAGLEGNMGQVNYSAAKAAIIGITKTVAREWGRYGVCVNAIAPLADTPMTSGIPGEMLKVLLKRVPLGRMGDPEEDIAPVAVFLASEMARYITGQVICADGGTVML